MTHGGMLDHALAYAARGIPVLPVRPGDKAPNRNLVAHGKDSATLDADLISEWWRRCPTGNIGLRPPDGVIVLDVDVQSGGDIADLGPIPGDVDGANRIRRMACLDASPVHRSPARQARRRSRRRHQDLARVPHRPAVHSPERQRLPVEL